MLETLEPRPLWQHFEAITAIPRASRNEGKVRAYIISLAETRGLTWKRDRAGNLVVYKRGVPGRVHESAMILQGHLDMVCEKMANFAHDFSRESLDLKVKNDFVSAVGTTLGADNGIGVAAALAVMESDDLSHGPLEFLFTVEEEVGLSGASRLDARLLKGKRLINLDAEEEGTIYTGCAGYSDTKLLLKLSREKEILNDASTALVTVRGLGGGHSGVDIHEGRGCANRIAARVLTVLQREYSSRLITLDGGKRRNAIAREAEAIVALPGDLLSDAVRTVRALQEQLREELAGVDDNVYAALHGVGITPFMPLTERCDRRAVNLLRAIPHGVIEMSREVPGLVETSTNYAVVRTSKSRLEIETSQRSLSDSKKEAASEWVSSIGLAAGAKVKSGEIYHSWSSDPQSSLLTLCRDVYSQLFGMESFTRIVHGGLECGPLCRKLENLEMVSIGPTIERVHTPDERVSISSVAKFYSYLTEILKHGN